MSIVKMNRLFEKGSIPSHDYCVYRLLNADRLVVYVGQTSTMEKRLYQHLANGKVFSFFECLPCEKPEATSIEAEEIIKYNPRLNSLLPKTPKYKTIVQARKLISDAIGKKANIEIENVMESLGVVFQRPQVKKMSFTYVSTATIDDAINKISNYEFVKLGEE